MTVWRVVVLVVIAAAEAIGVLMCGLSLVALGAWLVARIARRWGSDDVVIPPPVQKDAFRKLPPHEVDALRARAAARRARADDRRTEGHAIDSGEPARTIKLIGRR